MAEAERAAVILDGSNYSTSLPKRVLALNFVPISALHNALRVDAAIITERKNPTNSKHPFPSIFLRCSVAALLSDLLCPSLSCFRLNYNLVLGHFVRHSP